jgi:hypothetical protein
MQDRPTRKELMRGICNFLEIELVPGLQDPLKFHTRVAANLLRIIEREEELETGHVLKEVERLTKLLSRSPSLTNSPQGLKEQVVKLNEELCARIRSGDADRHPWRREVIDHIKKTLMEKLEIANPEMITKAQTKY